MADVIVVQTDRRFERRRDYHGKLLSESREGKRIVEVNHSASDEYGPDELTPAQALKLAWHLLLAVLRLA